jgi:DNA-binding PucR family transcriptional regulator
MTANSGLPPEVPLGTDARVAEVAKQLFARLPQLTVSIRQEVDSASPELVSGPTLVELLDSTIQTNIELFLEHAKGNVALKEIVLPSGAMAYARRLAQRGISSVALLRVYRIGQRRVANEALQEIWQTESDLDVAYAAARRFHEMTFAYVDHVSEQVVAEYEGERERWLANRNTVRTGMLTSILDGQTPDTSTAEPVLGYRLRQGHIAMVLWDSGSPGLSDSLQRLERALSAIAASSSKQPNQLFIPTDQSQAWGWIAIDPKGVMPSAKVIDSVLARDEELRSIKVAVGRAGTGIDGFRTSHLEAIRAFGVASADGLGGHRVTSFSEAGVRIVSLLSGDLAAAKAMTIDALGGLANDDEWAEQLRETLAVFFEESHSYITSAKRLHMHRNTVKYRIDKAIEMRGRPLEDDAVELHVALLLCHWLRTSVLAR